MNLTIDQKSRIFDRLFEEYIEEHGLGGMSKTDLDALFLYLIVKETGELNSFNLSNTLKTTESRIKSLLVRAAVKFDDRSIEDAWKEILSIFERVDFDIESLEKGQIRFQLSDPMLFRWLQDEVRKLGSTCTYNRSSEQVTMNLEILYKVLDYLWEDRNISNDWTDEYLEDIHERIQRIIGKIGERIEANMLEDLRERKKPKLKKYIETASQLAGIGGFIMPLLLKINT